MKKLIVLGVLVLLSSCCMTQKRRLNELTLYQVYCFRLLDYHDLLIQDKITYDEYKELKRGLEVLMKLKVYVDK